MENILILGQQRTGSNLLCYALSFFKNYRNINEFYSVDDNTFIYDLVFLEEERTQLFDMYKTKNWKVLLEKIHQEPILALDNLNFLLKKQNKVIKLLDHQFQKNNKLYKLIDMFDKVIITERSNTLDQYVSLKIADQTDVWWGQNTDNAKITLDINDYQEFCKNKNVYYEDLKFRLEEKNYITINYEQELSTGITDSLLFKLQQFLNNSPQIVMKDKNRIEKQSTINCINKIDNYDEIKQYL
jgi:LPS sulfotransferase NodH